MSVSLLWHRRMEKTALLMQIPSFMTNCSEDGFNWSRAAKLLLELFRELHGNGNMQEPINALHYQLHNNLSVCTG